MKSKVAPEGPKYEENVIELLSDEQVAAVLMEDEDVFMGDHELYIPLQEAMQNRADAAAILEYQQNGGRFRR